MAENTDEFYRYGKKDPGHLERERDAEKRNFELLRKLNVFDGCKRLLVVGCPNNFFIELCKSAGIDAKGVDIDPSIIDNESVFHADLETPDALNRKGWKESFDAVYSKGLIQHLEKPPVNFMNGVYDVLKPNGKLVILVRNEKSVQNIFSIWDNYKHKSTWTPVSIRGMLESFRFELEHLNPRFQAGVFRPLLCAMPFKWSIGGTIVAVGRKV